MLILYNIFICIHKSILFLTFKLYYLFVLLLYTIVIVFCNITVFWLLWQTNLAVCGFIILKEIHDPSLVKMLTK